MATELNPRVGDGADPAPPSRSRQEWPWTLGVGAVATALGFLFMRLWVVSLSVPASYRGDSGPLLMIFKGLTEGNWYYTNPRLGAPFGQEMFDYPTGDHLQLLGYKMIGWLTGGDIGLTMNLGILAGFFAVAAVGYWVLRKLDVARPWAVALAVLYSLLPYHFVRVRGHLLLAMYASVPLAVLLVVRQVRGEPAFVGPVDGDGATRFRVSLRDPVTRTALVAAIVIGSTGVYYAIFTGLLLVVAGLLAYSGTRNRVRLLSTIAVAGVIGIVLGAGMAPSVVYQAVNGSNPEAVNRPYSDVERYALKPVHLVLPIADHRVEVLGKPMRHALEGTVPTEGGQNLGLLGALGLVALVWTGLAALLSGKADVPGDLRLLSGLTLGTIIAATVAGFGSVLGIVGFTQIRAWNRVSVFVAFFVFVAVGLWVTRRFASRGGSWAWAVAVTLVVLGALDQTGPVSDELAESRETQWESDAAFVAGMERTLGEGAMVFQLPVIPFPESPPRVDMVDYDLLKGYLHSETLTWSYGGMRGRVPEWQAALVSADTERFVTGVIVAGFDALYIDRFGYDDRATKLEFELKEFLGAGPVTSIDGRLSYFDLRDAAASLSAYLGPEEAEMLRRSVLGDAAEVTVDFGEGFSVPETDGVSTWHWAGPAAELTLVNEGTGPLAVEVTMQLRTGVATGHPVRIEGSFGTAIVAATQTEGSFSAGLVLPPGDTVIRFTTDARPVNSPGDPRDLRFEVRDLVVKTEVWSEVEGWDP